MNLNQEKWLASINNSENSLIIDVRTQDEFNDGHIENSLNFNIYDAVKFIEEISKLDKQASVHVYCKSGVRSLQACEIIKGMGFSKVFNLIGGITEWKNKIV
ncbi:MAG: rhodanese [Flavobacteriaceae bacterium]|nr:rhodanese [Flavobacteriaceae bacterium]